MAARPRGRTTLREGTILRYPVHDANGMMLLNAGAPVTARWIPLLTRRGVRLTLHATLEVVEGPQAGLEIPVKQKPLTIGRDDACDVRPTSDRVSKQHCVIEKRDLGLFVIDSASTNGTFVNDKKIDQETELNDTDLLTIGDMTLKSHLFAALVGDDRVAKEVAGLVLADRDGAAAQPDAAAVTQPGFDKNVLREFQRLLEEEGKNKLE